MLGHFQRALRPGGHAIILVPQHPWLYTPTDKTLGHERRYTEADLCEKLERAGLEVVHKQGFNRVGTLGWYVSGKVLRKSELSPGQMKTYNRILPLAKHIERFPGWPGLVDHCRGPEADMSWHSDRGWEQTRAGPASRASA